MWGPNRRPTGDGCHYKKAYTRKCGGFVTQAGIQPRVDAFKTIRRSRGIAMMVGLKAGALLGIDAFI